MRYLTTLCACGILGAVITRPALAQQAGTTSTADTAAQTDSIPVGPPEGGHWDINTPPDFLLRKITLTKKQQDSVIVLSRPLEAAIKQAFARGGGGWNPEDRQLIQKFAGRRQKAIRALLTPEQQAIFDANVKRNAEAEANR